MKERMNRIARVVEPFKTDFIERKIRPLDADEVLIEVKASCVCGSDLHIFRGKHPSVTLPVTIGHEMSGKIVELGSASRDIFSLGDRVTVEPCITCGQCEACRHGDYGYCENISFTYRNGDGTMAKYMVAKQSHVFKLPDYLDYEEGALIEPLSVATHAVRRANIDLGDCVVVIGAGAIGILVAALCKYRGASTVVIADFSEERLNLAKAFGVTHTVNSRNVDLLEFVDTLTSGRGADKSFECVGKESSFIQAMYCLKRNGLATNIGIFEEPNISIPASRFVTHEIKVQGAQGYCWDFPIAIEVAKDLPLKKLITHRFALEEIQKALETANDRSAKSMKVLVQP
jgi:2-desacetyl-2-hydroxyethyl bacteriochlorophyllide A dehydrogenase